jgi:hypothetical protein
MKLAQTTMVESGLGGQFWFSAALAAKDACNVTYKERICKTPWEMMYGSKKNVSDYRAFGCLSYMYMTKDRRENGKHLSRASKAIHLGFGFRSQHERTQVLLL